jgi:diguanylate cyclase
VATTPNRIAVWIRRYGLLFGLLLVLSLSNGASPSFDALLDEADQVRSTDPERLELLLEHLEQQKSEATPAQWQLLQYLSAYRLITVKGQFDQATSELKPLFAAADNMVIKFRAGALLANNFAITRNFSEGLSYLDQTLALLPAIDDPEIRHQGLLVAAVIYNQVGQYELGRYYSELILSERPSERSRCIANHLRLEALEITNALPAGDTPILAAINQCEAEREVIPANRVRGLLARKLWSTGERAGAIKLLESRLDEVERTRYPRLIAEFNALLAEFSLGGGDHATAERHASRAITVSAGTFTQPLVDAYQTLYRVALARNDHAGALAHYRNHSEADKAHLSEVKARELAFQLAKHETLQKNNTIEILNKQNEVLRLQQQVASHAAQNNRLLLALLVVLLASIGYWAYRTKRIQMSFRRMAERDALTGISNRRHFIQRAEEALEYASRSGQNVCLLMFDLDHFKQINDSYGHPVGDWVLKATTDVCRHVCRKNDLIGRLGGEEFGILLIGCDAEAAAHSAELCRQRIEAIDSQESGAAFPISASFGLAQTRHAGYQLKPLLVQADQALYRSKRGGRNRVTVYDPVEAVQSAAEQARAGSAAAEAVGATGG